MGLVLFNNLEALESYYYAFIAPLVAIWLMEMELVASSVDIDHDFGTQELSEGFPSWSVSSIMCLFVYVLTPLQSVTLESLNGALMSVASTLKVPGAFDAFTTLSSSTYTANGADDPRHKGWLLRVATSDDLRRVACELSLRPGRLLLDWLDSVILVTTRQNTAAEVSAIGPVVRRPGTGRSGSVQSICGYSAKLGRVSNTLLGLFGRRYHPTHSPLLWRWL